MMTTLDSPPLALLLDDIVRGHRPRTEAGSVPANIPHLQSPPFDRFGIAVATTSGELFSSGDADLPFSIQSISKVFTLAMALGADDSGSLWSRVLREPSGTSFNSLVQLEVEHGIPRNPFINSGALVVTDHLMERTPDAAAQGEDLEMLWIENGRSASPELNSSRTLWQPRCRKRCERRGLQVGNVCGD